MMNVRLASEELIAAIWKGFSHNISGTKVSSRNDIRCCHGDCNDLHRLPCSPAIPLRMVQSVSASFPSRNGQPKKVRQVCRSSPELTLYSRLHDGVALLRVYQWRLTGRQLYPAFAASRKLRLKPKEQRPPAAKVSVRYART